MLKKQAKFFINAWRLLDLIIHFLCFTLAYYIRFNYFPLVSDRIPSFRKLLLNLLVLLIFWSISSNIFKLYKSKRLRKPWADWRPIFYSLLGMIPAYAALGFLLKALDISRLMLAIYCVLVFFTLGFWHQLVRILLSVARKRGYNQRSVLIVGGGSVGVRLAEQFQKHHEFGFNITGFLDDSKKYITFNHSRIKVLSKTEKLFEVLQNIKVDRVMITLPLSSHEKIQQLTAVCEYMGVEVNIVPDLFKFINFRTKVMDLNGIPVIGVRSNPVDSWQYVYIKRLFDIIFSLVALIITIPLILFSGLVIKLSSRGPMFFKQKRVGTGGREFMFYKLRTMEMRPVEETDTVWTVEEDPRRTWFGAFLRKTCIDELPQFWNVLKGDMSVVGPRPERPHFAKQFQKEVPKYMVRHQVKTGMTGWAQINGYRGDTSIPKRLKHDLYYIENWSLGFDMKIIAKTIVNGINGMNAY